jgi:hypothetical protein
MSRVILAIGLFALAVTDAPANVDVYPPLTRETLVGTWEGVYGIGRVPVVFHVLIAPRNEDSYMAEIYPENENGRVYRLQTCTITGANVYLRFLALPGGDGSEWWIEGEGYGDGKRAWINGRVGTGHNARNVGDATFYFAKGTWVRDIGEASRRGEQKISEAQAANK